jgi:hypothetical protein
VQGGKCLQNEVLAESAVFNPNITSLYRITVQGGKCLSVSLQNERGGRQRCFAIDSSALSDQTGKLSHHLFVRTVSNPDPKFNWGMDPDPSRVKALK